LLQLSSWVEMRVSGRSREGQPERCNAAKGKLQVTENFVHDEDLLDY
jgi:hypothetical protein